MSTLLEILLELEHKFFQLLVLLQPFKKECYKMLDRSPYKQQAKYISDLQNYLFILTDKTLSDNKKILMLNDRPVVIKPYTIDIDKNIIAKFLWEKLKNTQPKHFEECFNIPDLSKVDKPNFTIDQLKSKRDLALSIIADIKPLLPLSR